MGDLIILEGADLVGKTTLASLFVSRGYYLHHEGPPPSGVTACEHYSQVVEKLVAAHEDVVIDRFHLGEIVYGICAERGSSVTPRQIRALEQELVLRHSARIIVMFVTNEDVLKHRAVVRKEHYSEEYWRQNQIFRAMAYVNDNIIPLDSTSRNAVDLYYEVR